jgi:rubrerythrin
MNIFDQAMKIEKQGEVLYRSFAKEATDKGAIYIFTWLSEQEKKHYGIFKKMRAGAPVSVEEDFALKAVRSIFSAWKDTGAKVNVKTAQVELYRKALDVEEQSVRLYEEGARNADDKRAKAVFLQIAIEERVHRQTMENIIEFVTKPAIWAENAEFGYRGEDYYL